MEERLDSIENTLQRLNEKMEINTKLMERIITDLQKSIKHTDKMIEEMQQMRVGV